MKTPAAYAADWLDVAAVPNPDLRHYLLHHGLALRKRSLHGWNPYGPDVALGFMVRGSARSNEPITRADLRRLLIIACENLDVPLGSKSRTPGTLPD